MIDAMKQGGRGCISMWSRAAAANTGEVSKQMAKILDAHGFTEEAAVVRRREIVGDPRPPPHPGSTNYWNSIVSITNVHNYDGDGGTNDKEDILEKDWGKELRHGELIVKKRKWDAVSDCVIQGRYMDTDQAFTAFLVKWGEKCYFVTAYHAYCPTDPKSEKIIKWTAKELVREDVKEKFSRAVLTSKHRFLFSGDNKHHSMTGLELMGNRKIFINCDKDLVVVEMDTSILLPNVKMAFDEQFDVKKLQLNLSGDCYFLRSYTAVILHHPGGKELCRSSGDILESKGQVMREGKIAYLARTDGCSSGSPVLVTYEFEEENWPIIIGVHTCHPNSEKNKWNYGRFLLPCLNDIHEFIDGNMQQLNEEYVHFKLVAEID